MSLSAIDITMRQTAAALAEMKRSIFGDATVLTLVARVPGIEDAYVVVSADDLDEVIAVLRKENGEETP